MIKAWFKGSLATAGAVAMLAGSAGAQTFNFNTTGQFSGGCNSAVGLMAVCQSGGVTLTFTGQPTNALNYGDGSTVTLGNFSLAGTGQIGTNSLGPTTFTLWIHQVNPTIGSASTIGSITGNITRTTTSATGGLIWSPTEIVEIDPVMYDLIFQTGVNGINISAANNTAIQAVGTVVPEPSTYALMAAGLAAMGVVARRRRMKA